jgi:4,5-dihydroxyphthalate decarboxylase
MTTSTSTLTLKTALGSYPYVQALRDGSVKPEGIELQFADLPNGVVPAFRRMCRNLEYDVSEMAVVTYLAARRYGLPFTAIPAFPNARFHHAGILYNVNSGVQTPKDFEGKKVGARSYTLTPAVYARGILQNEYGVDLDKVTWVVADEEHVEQYHADMPANVERVLGADLVKMLADGELQGGLNMLRVDNPNIKQLIPNALEADRAAYQQDGIVPIDHCIVIKDELLAAHPWLAEALYRGFVAARQAFFAANPGANVGAASVVGDGDPLPYGFEANRKGIDLATQLSLEQKIIDKAYRAEELYLPFD